MRVCRLYSREGCNLLSVPNCLQNLIALLGPRPDSRTADTQLPFPACPSDDLQESEDVFPGSLSVHLELAWSKGHCDEIIRPGSCSYGPTRRTAGQDFLEVH